MKISIKTIFFCLLLFLFCDKSTNPVDGNPEWKLQRDQEDNITYYSIFFSDENHGWMTGSNGTVLNTANGGDTWQSQQSGVSSNLWDVHFVDNLHGWICGADNTLLKTSDGGQSWIDISPENSDNKIFVSIRFTDENNGWASSNHGEILQTIDGGFNWHLKKSGNVGGSCLSVIDLQTVYALSGKLYKTTSAGETWETINVPVPENYTTTSMTFKGNNHGWIVTQNGTGGTVITEFPVIMTKNGGQTWTSSEYLADGGLRCVYFVDENTGWVAGTNNVYKTIDSGNQWTLDFSPKDGELFARDMFFLDESHGWMMNYKGVVYRCR